MEGDGIAMEANTNYWLRCRLSRRALVRGSALAGVGAAAYAVAGCGDDSGGKEDVSPATGSGGSPTAAASPTVAATPTTGAKPVPGGSITYNSSLLPVDLDPYLRAGFAAPNHGLVYSKLLRYRSGTSDVAPLDLSMEPDLAAAMPEQPDALTFVFKLKANAKFQNVAPVNGRAVTAQDIAYAFDRYRTLSGSPHVAAMAFIDRVEAVDAGTVKLTTKYPYADTLSYIGGQTGAWISPKEFAEGPDAKSKQVGSGPFLFDQYVPGTSIRYRKNPDYFDAPYPYFDEVNEVLQATTATRVSDFVARKVSIAAFAHGPDGDQAVKKARPDAKSEEIMGWSSPSQFLHMRTDKPPFNDRRVRQAISMALNRQAFRDALSGGEGLDGQVYSPFPVGRPVKDLPQARYWQYNVAEARKLMAAAIGDGKTIDTTLVHVGDATYGATYGTYITLTQAQLKEIGINITPIGMPYPQYLPDVYFGGKYEGLGHSPQARAAWLDFVTTKFTWRPARGTTNLSYVNDPKLDDLLDKQRGQFKPEERAQTIRQIEELIAEEQYEVYYSALPVTAFWDADIKNYRPSAWASWTHFMKAWRA